MSAVVGLVLAAGFSRRFGSDKRRALLGDGSRLLSASVANACAVLDDVWVVLRPGDDRCELGLFENVRVVVSECAEQGMGHSLASGMAAIQHTSNADAVAIFLGDMPWVSQRSLYTLFAVAAADRIIVPRHAGQAGHPVVFGRQFWPELLQLGGDSGARSLLHAHPHAIHPVEVDDPGVLRDVDMPADLAAPLDIAGRV